MDKTSDPRRALSAQGRRDVALVAARMQHQGVAVHRILHSSKTRAEETAAILAAALSPPGGTAAMKGLKPSDPPQPVANAISGWAEDTMLVGHLPFLEDLARLLLDTTCAPPDFPAGSAAVLERDAEGHWRLVARFETSAA